MKKLVLLLFVFSTQFNFAQNTINLGDFDEVKVFDKIEVTLMPSDENKAVVTGDTESNVEVVNKNGKLKIRMKLAKLLSGEGIKVSLYFKNIQSIDVNEGSKVSCEDTFKQTALSLSVQEGAILDVAIEVQKVTSSLSSGGIINVTGTTENQIVSIFSGGILNAKELNTSQTTISISAGGNAEITASTLVDAKVKAGGTIYIFGKPKQINQQTFAGGTIVEK
jgi:hypothetical protein